MSEWSHNVEDGYDRVASTYADRIFDELAGKPLDREILDRFSELVRPAGRACDLGCGPGQIARYLHERGLPVIGIDLSAQMVAQAQRLSPHILFRQGTMLALDFDDGSLGGIAAFYSIIHIPREHLGRVFAEMWRVLCAGGVVLLAFHLGDEDVHLDEWWDEAVSLDFFFFRREEIEDHLKSAGFIVRESIEREPYPEVEHQSRRAYILAEKPATAV